MYCWILFGILLWIDREPPLGRRVLVCVLVLAVTFAYGYHLRHLTDHFTARRVIGDTVRFAAIYAWALAAWFAAPVLADWKAERYSRPFWLATVFLFIYGAICFATAVSAARIRPSRRRALTQSALERAIRTTWASGDSPGRTFSSTPAGCTSKRSPREWSRSLRRGEADARQSGGSVTRPERGGKVQGSERRLERAWWEKYNRTTSTCPHTKRREYLPQHGTSRPHPGRSSPSRSHALHPRALGGGVVHRWSPGSDAAARPPARAGARAGSGDPLFVGRSGLLPAVRLTA